MDTNIVTLPRWPDTPPVIVAETPGWTCTVYPIRDKANCWKVIAVETSGHRAIHSLSLNAAQVVAFVPTWSK